MLVRSFKDSNGDGVGDFQGLTEKLDYLQWLGVDCLWVPPFFTSPLRDGGYDVADYTNILPEVGTVEDFHDFLDEAHERGIRVIIDFVMNHTSDAHPWFQASREDPDGPVRRLLRLVRHRRALRGRPDHLRRHRAVELDLGPGPPAVLLAPVLLPPAGPQLRQPEGPRGDARGDVASGSTWASTASGSTRCPTSTSARAPTARTSRRPTSSCARCARFVDDNYPGRVLLAEANQWPPTSSTTSATSTSGGDECHMCFHFPVMPRIFMAVRRESRFPISEILEQTPAIPTSCQWGIFLRNHDELTLEMVTDEDRDYMWGEYAKDPRMKANIGIRRRLAPLLDNDINQMELFTALLLSLPGSPVLYYGDEIGMGDNIWLGDRDGVRTPMQWTPDRNAGFSVATPGRLHLPAIQDPVFGYQRVNVETELENASSLLHWTRRMIHARKQHPAFGLGDVHRPRRLQPERAVLRPRARRRGRQHRHRAVRQQPVPLPAAGRARPAPLGGRAPRRAARRGPVPARSASCPTCSPWAAYGFYWFRLPHREARPRPADGEAARVTTDALTAVADYLATARWFGGKGRDLTVLGVTPRRHASASAGDRPRSSASSSSTSSTPTASRRAETYQVPLAYYAEPQERLEHALVGAWDDDDLGAVYVYDAVHDREATALLAAGVRRGRRRRPRRGDADASTGCPGTTSTSRRTRRCSPASRATPRSPSARTR